MARIVNQAATSRAEEIASLTGFRSAQACDGPKLDFVTDFLSRATNSWKLMQHPCCAQQHEFRDPRTIIIHQSPLQDLSRLIPEPTSRRWLPHPSPAGRAYSHAGPAPITHRWHFPAQCWIDIMMPNIMRSSNSDADQHSAPPPGTDSKPHDIQLESIHDLRPIRILAP